jgi:hypothetical protein
MAHTRIAQKIKAYTAYHQQRHVAKFGMSSRDPRQGGEPQSGAPRRYVHCTTACVPLHPI